MSLVRTGNSAVLLARGLMLSWVAGLAMGCGDDGGGGGDDNCTTPSGAPTGAATGAPTGSATGSTTPTGTSTGTTPTGPTVVEWLVDVQRLGNVHGNYGKGSYCGALELERYPGYEAIRCTDGNTMFFSDNGDGTLRMEEAIYVHRITESANPNGWFPWFVDDGYSGSLIYTLTPVGAPAGADEHDVMEFEAEVVDWAGNDFFWSYSVGIKNKMVFARGQTDDLEIDWKTADADDTGAWTATYPAMWMGWAIHLYPTGGGQPPAGASAAFLNRTCDAGDLIPGAQISDGAGGFLAAGPGYCPPECRMPTANDPDGANGLPPCVGDFLLERPRGATLH